jgi:alpha-tubulin suppressor-like RCC1 family protein
MNRKFTFLFTILIFFACSTIHAQSQDLYWKTFGPGGPRFFAIRSDGTLWASGLAYLGDGSNVNRPIPVQIGSDTNWVSVSSGGIHTLAIKKDSTLWAWGFNSFGQLGDGTTTARNSPVQIGNSKWIGVFPGSVSTLAIKKDGTLWGWGKDMGRTSDGRFIIDVLAPVQIGTETDWASFAMSENHTLALKNNGTLWGWGSNGYGELGNSTNAYFTIPIQIGTDNDWIQIHAGSGFSLALKSNGTIWSWGRGVYGGLGDGSTSTRYTPLQMGNSNQWRELGGGHDHGVAVQFDGSVWAWGWNNVGQLGDGTTIQRNSPVLVNTSNPIKIGSGVFYNYSVLLSSDSKTFCFTGSNYGQVGNKAVIIDNDFDSIYSCDNSYCLQYQLATSTSNLNIPIGGINNRVDFQMSCKLVSSISPSGINPVSGEIRDSVWVEPSVPSTAGGVPYVQRHYGITPVNNPGTSTATITLYYTQADFTAYNEAQNHGLDLPHDAFDAPGYRANVRVVKRSGTSNNGTGIYETYTGSGQVIIPTSVVWIASLNAWAVTFNVTGFSGFFITSSPSDILPVTLNDFTVYLQGSNGILVWKTSDEVNLATYLIERSTDGRSFSKVGDVTAENNSSVNVYNYIDRNIATIGAHDFYYRLKMVDNDGSFKYSSVIRITLNNINTELFPNPVKELATLTIYAIRNETTNYQIMDASGKVVLEKTVDIMKGQNKVIVDTKLLRQGLYILKLKGYSGREIKFIKQ